MAPTSVGIVAAAQGAPGRGAVRGDQGLRPGRAGRDARVHAQNGCAPEFALWSFVDLGYLTYYVVLPAGDRRDPGRRGRDVPSAGRSAASTTFTITADPTRPDVERAARPDGPLHGLQHRERRGSRRWPASCGQPGGGESRRDGQPGGGCEPGCRGEPGRGRLDPPNASFGPRSGVAGPGAFACPGAWPPPRADRGNVSSHDAASAPAPAACMSGSTGQEASIGLSRA